MLYRKTDKGLQEIETRAHRLPPRLRSALILVDGRRSVDELRPMILQQPDETLSALAEQGFIELVSAAEARAARAPVAQASPVIAVPAPPQTPQTPQAPQTPPAARTFEIWRRDVVRQLTDLVGPLGEALAMRIERARTPEELRPLIDVAQQVVGNTRGARTAAEFRTRIGEP